jgi:CheY-like chemotaxis protein
MTDEQAPVDGWQPPHASSAAIGINAGVAQEFNNINTSILGFVDLIRYEVRGNLPLEHDLDEIARLTLRASRLAGQLLSSNAVNAPPVGASGTEGTPSQEYALADLPGAETILVVDDETAVRSVVCRGLRRRGYHVLEATNGEDALIVADRYAAPIHLVVSDVVMPKMDGRALFDQLRHWYPNTCCLFISGYAQGAITPSDLAGARMHFLAKPFSLDDLCREVQVILSAAAGDAG